MSKYQNVTVTREGHVGVVVMCSAPVNALTFDLLDDLSGAFHELETDKDVWAVVLCSGMRLFAAGADLRQHRAKTVCRKLCAENVTAW